MRRHESAGAAGQGSGKVLLWTDIRPGQVLTVDEAAAILRIGRTAAYSEARRYLETGEGLPVLRLGRALRVPGHRLIRLLEGE